MKAQNYDIQTTFDESKRIGEIVSLGDNQALRSIRDIRKRTVDKDKIERLYAERNLLMGRLRKPRSATRRGNIRAYYTERLADVQSKINRTMYIDDYVTVEIEHNSHYDKMYKDGFCINGKRYVRFSCSASQARVSTVAFCPEEIRGELERRLENGRDKTKKIAESKYNAYFGLYTSATRLVSEPRIAVVKDFENSATYMSNFVIENPDWDKDDTVEVREVTTPMNRTDGMGLISPQMAKQWADDLGLKYTPAQWIVRQSFLKGMVCVFDFHAYCEECNGGNYLVDTVYTDEAGNPIKADLHNVDVIVSESQFKLWDSFPSVEQYVANYRSNKLYWGVTGYAPKRLKDMLRLNYQFIQTLDLKWQDIEELCEDFVRWINGVSYEDRAYMLLFLLGLNINADSVKQMINKPEKNWMLALLFNKGCMGDSFIRGKIRELTHHRIENGCMGEVLVKGNFQMLVSDPYAYMQHVCGQEVTGLLKEGEYYCHYWNERGVDTVDSMRSPMTSPSEHVVAKLAQNEQTEKWYSYCNTGFILNWYGNDVVRYAGADFDGDIVATTNNQAMIRCVQHDELPVTYDAPKPEKKLFTRDDLQVADKFGFGSIIGSITNKSTNDYAVLPVIEQRFGVGSKQAKLERSRISQCCVAQSKAIDKTKLGKKVKGIPKAWTQRNRIEPDDSPEVVEEKMLLNDCLLNRRPYFFRYRYRDDKRAYDDYYATKNCVCLSTFKMSVHQLAALTDRTPQQEKWLQDYYEFCPLVDSDSAMNLLCKYLEQVRFDVKRKVAMNKGFDPMDYMSGGDDWQDIYNEVAAVYSRFVRDMHSGVAKGTAEQRAQDVVARLVTSLQYQLRMVSKDDLAVADALVWYAYVNHPSIKKDTIWTLYGRQMATSALMHAKARGEKVLVPVETTDIGAADTEYLGRYYTMQEVVLHNDEE